MSSKFILWKKCIDPSCSSVDPVIIIPDPSFEIYEVVDKLISDDLKLSYDDSRGLYKKLYKEIRIQEEYTQYKNIEYAGDSTEYLLDNEDFIIDLLSGKVEKFVACVSII